MARTVFGPDHEPAAWLRELESARLAAMRAAGVPLGTERVIATLEPPDVAGDGYACARCHERPSRETMHGLITNPAPGVLLVANICDACAVLEAS